MFEEQEIDDNFDLSDGLRFRKHHLPGQSSNRDFDMNTTARAFVRGVLDGFSAPISIFAPGAVHSTVDEWVLTPSYRPWSEDLKNLQQDFDKAMSHATKEISPKQNSTRAGR